MKTRTFNLWMFALCLLAFSFQSCSDDEIKPEPFELMEWKSDVNLTLQGYNTYQVDVPAQGGTMVFTCINCDGVSEIVCWEDDKIVETDKPLTTDYTRDWGSIKVQNNIMTVTVLPEASKKFKEIRLSISYSVFSISDFVFNLK